MTLEFAMQVGKLFNKTVPSEWAKISKAIAIPIDEEKNIHLEYDDYNGTIIKQARSPCPPMHDRIVFQPSPF